jgi:hypothetical protein
MRRTVARAAAALGVACLLIAPAATSARAADTALPIYQATGISQGILTTFALKPSIFDPLIEAGTSYTKTSITSEGGGLGHSLAAQVYPGSLIIGFLGCGGSAIPAPFGPAITSSWVQANYPAGGGCQTSAHGTLLSLPPAGSGGLSGVASITSGDMRVKALEGTGGASIETERFLLSASPTQPVLSVGSMITDSNSTAIGKTVQNVVTSTAKDVSLLGGIVKIASITSTSIASSDGTTGDAKGALTFAGVSVLANGTRHDVTIDNKGIHSTDKGLTRDQNLSLGEQINDLFAQAGITITAATPAKIIDGASGESSVGGLVISLDGTVPSVSVPQEVAPVLGALINNIPTQCLSDLKTIIPPLKDATLCFGPGVLPGPGTQARLTFTIGATDAFAVGGLGFIAPPFSECTGVCDGVTPPITPTSVLPEFNGGGPQPLAQPSAAPPSGPLRLFGLVARLPAVALLWGGLGLLVLAMGFAYGPSLRHARAR